MNRFHQCLNLCSINVDLADCRCRVCLPNSVSFAVLLEAYCYYRSRKKICHEIFKMTVDSSDYKK